MLPLTITATMLLPCPCLHWFNCPRITIKLPCLRKLLPTTLPITLPTTTTHAIKNNKILLLPTCLPGPHSRTKPVSWIPAEWNWESGIVPCSLRTFSCLPNWHLIILCLVASLSWRLICEQQHPWWNHILRAFNKHWCVTGFNKNP